MHSKFYCCSSEVFLRFDKQIASRTNILFRLGKMHFKVCESRYKMKQASIPDLGYVEHYTKRDTWRNFLKHSRSCKQLSQNQCVISNFQFNPHTFINFKLLTHIQ